MRIQRDKEAVVTRGWRYDEDKILRCTPAQEGAGFLISEFPYSGMKFFKTSTPRSQTNDRAE